MYETPVKIYAKTGSIYTVTSRLAMAKGDALALPDTVTAENLVLQLQKVNADHSIDLALKESNALMKYVTLKAYKFPYINLLWIGVLVTVIGMAMSMVHRIRR